VAGAPRSQRLLFFHSSATTQWSPNFICPESAVTLLKTAYILNLGTAPCKVAVTVGVAGMVGTYVVTETLEIDTPLVWEGWVALHPGDATGAYAAGADVFFYISGAVLPGNPLFPPGELATPLVYPPAAGTTPTAGTSPSPVLPTVQRTVRASRRR
jgi:hypothetical protein